MWLPRFAREREQVNLPGNSKDRGNEIWIKNRRGQELVETDLDRVLKTGIQECLVTETTEGEATSVGVSSRCQNRNCALSIGHCVWDLARKALAPHRIGNKANCWVSLSMKQVGAKKRAWALQFAKLDSMTKFGGCKWSACGLFRLWNLLSRIKLSLFCFYLLTLILK